jgi:DNA-directed RNA polymerase subunit RPC12/RpoP
MTAAMKMDSKNFGYPGSTRQTGSNTVDAYKEFDALELYCPRCKQAVPLRKRLLLVLPEGDKYEYLCALCSTTVGTKMDRQAKPVSLIV